MKHLNDHDRLVQRLSEYVDGNLEGEDRDTIEAHLQGCDVCVQTLGELQRVVGRAQTVSDRGPSRDLWPGIAQRIGASVDRPSIAVAPRAKPWWSRRLTLSTPQLLAASVASVMVTSVGLWAALGMSPTEVPLVAGNPTPAFVSNVSNPVGSTPYDGAVADLLTALANDRSVLSPETIRVVEANLAIIDRAIASAREALLEDPESNYLRRHLDQTVQQKLTLLRRVNGITSAS